jgi:hypothetical protein
MRRRKMLVIISLLMMLLVLAGTIWFARSRITRIKKAAVTASPETDGTDQGQD